jgi:DtxR family Mn-dependent transcriptional regulator
MPKKLTREIQEILQTLYSMEEERTVPAAGDAVVNRARVSPKDLDDAVARGVVLKSDQGYTLAECARDEAASVARRHRLAERLLHDVLHVDDEATENVACEFEHFLEEDVAESICTLLGHPTICPHGKPIPRGRCCGESRRELEPVLARLSELAVGETGSIAYVHTRNPSRLDRLSAFGMMPGTGLRVKQRWPSVVITLGETELALDKETAADVFVRRSAHRP